VGVLREPVKSPVSEQGGGTLDPKHQQQQQQQQEQYRHRRRRIEKVNYDTLTRPASGETDGDWEVANPVDLTTGLFYGADSSYSNSADWSDLVPTFLRHGYESSLGRMATSSVPLLMIERSYNPPPLRQQLLEILMEECQLPATFLGRDATMACYACGRTTSTVIDIGYSGTTVSPVSEGYVEQKGIRRSPVGTMAMDEMSVSHIQAILNSISSSGEGNKKLKPLYEVRNPNAKRKDAFRRLALLEVGRDCRESGAGQAINTVASKSLQVPSMGYCLPDGQTVDMSSQNRFGVAELVVGRAPEEDEPKPREEYLEKTKKKYDAILRAATEEDTFENGGAENEDDEERAEERKEQSEKYTEATAVGLTSRRGNKQQRTRKSERVKSTVDATTKAPLPPKVNFDNRILQRACVPYLETLMEQLTATPVANMVCDAAFRCDRDQQPAVLGNVVLAGGGACIGPTDQSVPDTLKEQIEAIIHTHTPGWRVKILSPGLQERAIASWLGGSILGSLGTFHEMWITKAEYEEWGSAIVNRKCP
jgi:actin-related protein